MNFDKELDARGLNCPLPILKTKKSLNEPRSICLPFVAKRDRLGSVIPTRCLADPSSCGMGRSSGVWVKSTIDISVVDVQDCKNREPVLFEKIALPIS